MSETFFRKEVEKYQYIQLPKWLFKEPYKRLSANAKLMYAMLFNRLSLSLDNSWHDTKGQVFMYFTNNEFCEELGCSEKTVTKTKKELKDVGLLQEERQGLNKPNRLYIKGPETQSEPQKLPPRTVKTTVQEKQKVQTIKTDIIKTDITNNIDIVSEVILYLNQVAGTRFTAGSQATQKHINARLKEGYTLEDFKQVIDTKTSEWQGTEFAKFLRPVTLFGTKFENYINQQPPRSKKNDATEVDERLGF
ncbi:conserved phage C-terminal domain-containing protein [Streptococcus suis]|uniref:Conserved phage C-terminal domain-containing protein n=1 Tax=Streptococcus suis TaxID=1307 RepID=A0A9X4MTK5_STRSU|nr:conserved phage C-terminal domain-containing protein [Streptococcus suis]MBY5024562.1 conserved phage C-terminal domain-containing protein [Streptococcus suis]MDG4525901.1 conserved phage C-terminal domain-containing protein [Streptococcus suis]MDG4528287.1 conserved phage C-terminal domain-containing protein [Streptococcus suis]QZT17213.1 conserved phage C-terminal domain-containing protein [Streptococcus suis]